MPLIEVARAASQADALAGLDQWRQRHPAAAALLEPADILVDSMRGRSSTWTRIRLNLRHSPEAERPAQEALEAIRGHGAPAVAGTDALASLRMIAECYRMRTLLVSPWFSDAERIVATAQRTKRKLVVGYILRHHPSWIRSVSASALR